MGADLPDITARPLSDFIARSGWELIMEGIGDLTESDELEIDLAKDRKRFFRIFRNPVLDERGRLHGWVIVIRDESQLRRAEVLEDEVSSIVPHAYPPPINTIPCFATLLVSTLQKHLVG